MPSLSPERILIAIPDEAQENQTQQQALLKNALAERKHDATVIRGYIDYIDAARTKLGIVLLKTDNPPLSDDKAESGSGLGVYDLSLSEVD